MFKNQKAFGIVEVLVAAGLLSIIGVGVATLIVNASKQQQGIQAKDQQRDVTSEFRSLFSNKTACLNTFTTVAAGGGTVTLIKDGSVSPGITKYSIPGNDKSGLLKFDEFRLSPVVYDPASTWGNMNFSIKMSKVSDTGTVKDIRPDIITLRVRILAGTIEECFSIGTQSDGLWQISAVNSNDIYYSAGKVGIGNSNPSQQLQITENMLIPTAVAATNGNLFFGGNTAAGTNGLRLFHLDTAGGGFIDMKSATATNGIIFRADTANGGTERMRIRADGNVGIGTTNPTERLQVAGNISAVAFLYTSDARLKKNIIDFTEGLNFVNQMRPVRYQWKSNSRHDIGFIAQDIEKIVPELTTTDSAGIKRIDYAKMVPILVKAIQEQQIQIEELQKQLNQK